MNQSPSLKGGIERIYLLTLAYTNHVLKVNKHWVSFLGLKLVETINLSYEVFEPVDLNLDSRRQSPLFRGSSSFS